jgi:hypothetical protein
MLLRPFCSWPPSSHVVLFSTAESHYFRGSLGVSRQNRQGALSIQRFSGSIDDGDGHVRGPWTAVELEVERVVTNKTYVVLPAPTSHAPCASIRSFESRAASRAPQTHEEFSPPRLREPSPPGSRKASYQGGMSPISAARRVSSPGLYVSNQPKTYRTGAVLSV